MRWLVPLAILAFLVGCGRDDSDDTAAAAEWPGGVPWALASGLDAPGWETVRPTATFADGRVAGSTGCNRFTGSYERDGAALSVGAIATTQKGCEPTAEAVERAYLDALEQVAEWRLDDGELVLIDGGDGELLRYASPSPEGAWTVTMLLTGDALTSPKPGTELTAIFDGSGMLSGSAGCNDYRATYALERGAIEIGAPTASERSCRTPPGVMEQERAYLAALPLAASYQVEGDRLSLLTEAGTFVATYER